MEVWKTTGYDGKEQLFVWSTGGDRKCYKERKLSLSGWRDRLFRLMKSAGYTDSEARRAFWYFVEVRGFWRADRFYIQPRTLVQNLNDLGGLDNIEYA